VLSLCRGCVFQWWLSLFLDLLAVRSLLGLLWVRRGSLAVSADAGESSAAVAVSGDFSGHRSLAGVAVSCVFWAD